MGGYEEMLTSADKVGGWVKKGQKHADIILERLPINLEGSDLLSDLAYWTTQNF